MGYPPHWYFISESYGFHDIDNELFIMKCEKLADVILKEFPYGGDSVFKLYSFAPYNEKNINKTPKEVIGKGNSRVEFEHLSAIEYALDFDWIDNIRIFMNIGEKDSMVVDNTVSYNFEAGETKIITKRDYIFKRLSNKKNDGRNYRDVQIEPIFPLIRCSDKIIYGSIIISMRKNNMYLKRELVLNLMHELGHLYDVFKNKTTFAFINRDLVNVYRNEYNIETIKSRFPIGSDAYNIVTTQATLSSYINDANKSFSTKKEKVKKLNEIGLDCLVLKNVYRLNKSEMTQHIKNFVYDISLHTSEEVKNVSGSDEDFIYSQARYENNLCELSETFRAYHNTAVVFRMIVEYVSPEVKMRFAHDVIEQKYEYADLENAEDIEPYTTPYTYNKLFGEKEFDNPDLRTYLVCKFDDFFNYHIKNIDTMFLKKCCAIHENLQFLIDRYRTIYEHSWPIYSHSLFEEKEIDRCINYI